MKKKRALKKDPGILIRIWKQENGIESVKKFYIRREANTVDVDLWLSTNTTTEVQCNYPATPLEK